MKTKRVLSFLLSLFLCFALLAAAASCMAEPVEDIVIPMTGTPEEPVPFGEGETAFLFCVVDADGLEYWFEIYTDAETVGDALLSLGLVEGENGPYGLYIKTVCGITADYETDGHYWAFYIDGDYAMSGVDTTAVDPGCVYTLKVE